MSHWGSYVLPYAYSAVHGRLGEVIGVQQLSFVQIFGLGADLIYTVALRLGLLLLPLLVSLLCQQVFKLTQGNALLLGKLLGPLAYQ